jgi:hypothetical protein
LSDGPPNFASKDAIGQFQEGTEVCPFTENKAFPDAVLETYVTTRFGTASANMGIDCGIR